MAKNTGNGTRQGIIKNRTQFYNSQNKKWVKRDTNTGKILKTSVDPFKNIRKEGVRRKKKCKK